VVLEDTPHSRQFHALAAMLRRWEGLWRPSPFHEETPPWCGEFPALATAVLALADDQVTALEEGNTVLICRMQASIPDLEALHDLIRVPDLTAGADQGGAGQALPPAPPRLLAHVPGRKQEQIRAFAAAVGPVRHPLLEWCAGKGHLGRLMAWRHGRPVASLEIDAPLVVDGQALARRAGLHQDFICADALAPGAQAHLPGRHVLALHACGDLHGALLRGAVARGVPALDVSPCCYYRIATHRYVPFCVDAGLDLSRDELHLAVTETVTAGGRDRRRGATAAAWKLAFLELRQAAGVDRRRPFPPVPASWLAQGFEGWMIRLAAREGVAIPADLDWPALEARAWQRRYQVIRLDLVRFAFRRALELWLVLDRAVYLERAGYAVRVGTFCPRQTSPRNLLIQARFLHEI